MTAFAAIIRVYSSWCEPPHLSSPPSMLPGDPATTAPITNATTQSHPARAPCTKSNSTRARTSPTSSRVGVSAGQHLLESRTALFCSLNSVAGRCDERFAGYGGNKAACLFEMYLSGVSYYVLSDHFLIHQSHKYEEEARREEVKPVARPGLVWHRLTPL